MSSKKQTAVEWLVSQLSLEHYDDTVSQALAMEKENDHYFFECGRQFQVSGELTFDKCYRETYEQNS